VTAAAHHNAIVALLAGLNVTVYADSVPNNPTTPYVVVWSGTWWERSNDVTASGTGWREFEVQTSTVGVTGQQARWAAGRVHEALAGARPVVAGRVTGPVRLQTMQPAREDLQVDPSRWYVPSVWRFTSLPA
jgi:hypothetical protein